MAEEDKNVEQEVYAIHGDILDAIISRLPLIDLLPAAHVSRAWRCTVSFPSGPHSTKSNQWLIIYVQSTHGSKPVSTAYGYDPQSEMWLLLKYQPLIIQSSSFSTLRASHSGTLLYTLSSSHFSFSLDPLHLEWHQDSPPVVCRLDPIVASIDHRFIIVAGGVCNFENDSLAVEMYDSQSCTWEMCEPMPEIFKHYDSSMWVSVAVDSTRMFVVSKESGIMYWFDVCTKTWKGPYDVSIAGEDDDDKDFSSYRIGFCNGSLILVCIVNGHDEKSKGLKLYEISVGESSLIRKGREVGEMPKEMFDQVFTEESQYFTISSIEVLITDKMVYVFANRISGEFFTFEYENGWKKIENQVGNTVEWVDRLVISCSNVGLKDLQKACSSMSLKLGRL